VRRKSNKEDSDWTRCYEEEDIQAKSRGERAKSERTCISNANFFAIPLFFSYRMMHFFFRLSMTAVMPCTALSSALGSHEFGVEPYSGFEASGTWFREKRLGSSGA
jgi:hypothetical protein